MLPYRHNYTLTGEFEETGFFIPYYAQSLRVEFMDSRGVCDVDKYKEELQLERDNLLAVPEEYYKKCAERCWFAEEAFSLEGVNKFNKMLISELLAEIRLHKRGPKPEKGYLDYFYKNNKHTFDNITGFKWIPNSNGKVQILEHPVWSDLYKPGEDELKYDEMQNLYVGGVDGIDIGASQTSSETKSPSDFCLVIYKRAFGMSEPKIVAVYKDRPNNIREAYKTAMCLIRYYNCKVNIEATRVGFVTWARENNGLQYFMKRPRATLQDVKYGTSKLYGTPATRTIIAMQTDLIADFVEDYCHTIWFEEVLELLTSYSDENKTKFDIIAALGMVFLADQELSGRQPVKVILELDTFRNFGYYTDERGYKRFGVIPTLITLEFKRVNQYDPYRYETSDPRLLQN